MDREKMILVPRGVEFDIAYCADEVLNYISDIIDDEASNANISSDTLEQTDKADLAVEILKRALDHLYTGNYEL